MSFTFVRFKQSRFLQIRNRFHRLSRPDENNAQIMACLRISWLDAERCLHDTYTQEFSLDRIADAAGLSKYYLERVFKKATGLPPHTYVLMLRIEAAKKLLASSSMPIAEIAMELGFSDQSHFTNAFKRRTGFTPQAYRLGTK